MILIVEQRTRDLPMAVSIVTGGKDVSIGVACEGLDKSVDQTYADMIKVAFSPSVMGLLFTLPRVPSSQPMPNGLAETRDALQASPMMRGTIKSTHL